MLLGSRSERGFGAVTPDPLSSAAASVPAVLGPCVMFSLSTSQMFLSSLCWVGRKVTLCGHLGVPGFPGCHPWLCLECGSRDGPAAAPGLVPKVHVHVPPAPRSGASPNPAQVFLSALPPWEGEGRSSLFPARAFTSTTTKHRSRNLLLSLFFPPFHSLFVLVSDAPNAAPEVSLKTPLETPVRPLNTWKDSLLLPRVGMWGQELHQLQVPEGPELLCQALIAPSLVGFINDNASLRYSPGWGQVCIISPPRARSDESTDCTLSKHCSAASSLSKIRGKGFSREPGGAGMGWKCWHCRGHRGAWDTWGVIAPGWEFCFPLLCFNSRPVEIRDQQSKSNCSSSFGLFSQGDFFVGRIPCIVLEQGWDVQWDPWVLWNGSLLAEHP